jgi:hypothetical protein
VSSARWQFARARFALPRAAGRLCRPTLQHGIMQRRPGAEGDGARKQRGAYHPIERCPDRSAG